MFGTSAESSTRFGRDDRFRDGRRFPDRSPVPDRRSRRTEPRRISARTHRAWIRVIGASSTPRAHPPLRSAAARSGDCASITTPRARLHPVEQVDDVVVAHADAAMGTGARDVDVVGTAVDVDVAAHGVDAAQAVPAGLGAGEPEDPGEDPVAVRVRGCAVPECSAHSVGRRPTKTVSGTAPAPILARIDMELPRGVHSLPSLLAGAVGGGGHGIGPEHLAPDVKRQALAVEVDADEDVGCADALRTGHRLRAFASTRGSRKAAANFFEILRSALRDQPRRSQDVCRAAAGGTHPLSGNRPERTSWNRTTSRIGRGRSPSRRRAHRPEPDVAREDPASRDTGRPLPARYRPPIAPSSPRYTRTPSPPVARGTHHEQSALSGHVVGFIGLGLMGRPMCHESPRGRGRGGHPQPEPGGGRCARGRGALARALAARGGRSARPWSS